VQERVLVHRALSRVLQVLLRSTDRRGRRTGPPAPGPVRFLVLDLWAQGGSVRSNLMLAQHLSQTHPVEFVSVFREVEELFFPRAAGFAHRVLDDRRPGARRGLLQRVLSRLPTVLVHPEDRAIVWQSLWTDLQLLREVRRMQGGWLVTTRPGFALLAARFAPPGVVVVARDHDNFLRLSPAVRADLQRVGAGLDAVSVLSPGDERDYRAWLAGKDVRVFYQPNALDPMAGEPAAVRDRVVLAAGRLAKQKGYDLLIPAWAPVAARHPDWRLKIFGEGDQQPKLEKLVDELGLGASVALLPATRRIGEEMARASVFVLSSRYEGFGRVLIEALSKALPVVSFDCPRGPSDIITPGSDGLLVPPEDVEGLTAALLRLVEDEPLRARMAAQGPRTAAAYDIAPIGARWERELAALVAPQPLVAVRARAA
jgi:glycosyltransferase involved in cell wall biosynthesis